MREPRDAIRYEGDHGRISFWTIAPHIYATELRGNMTQAMSNLIIERATPMYEAGVTVYGVHNWLAMTNYDSICRVDLTSWIMRNKALSVLHIGSASRMVSMGVAVARLALGDLLHVHGDLSSLEQALRTIMPARR